jgi:hypothetical protein
MKNVFLMMIKKNYVLKKKINVRIIIKNVRSIYLKALIMFNVLNFPMRNTANKYQ